MMHLTNREASATIFYRYKMKLSITHIARLLERSTRTIHKVISKNCWIHKLYDKRRWSHYVRRKGETWFRKAYARLTWFLELWKEGQIGNIQLLLGKTAEGEPP